MHRSISNNSSQSEGSQRRESNIQQRDMSPKPRDRDNSRGRSNSNSPSKGHETNTLNTCLYIGNLDIRCRQEEFKQLCLGFGPCEYCYIVYEPVSSYDRARERRTSRGYGFVKYNIGNDAKTAKQTLDGKDFQGRRLNVQVSKRNRPRQATPGEYLGRMRHPSPRRDNGYPPRRRRSYSRSSSDSYRRRRRHEKQRKRHHRDRDRERKDRQSRPDRERERTRYRSRSPGQHRRHRHRRSSRSMSPQPMRR